MPRTHLSISIILLAIVSCSVVAPAQSVQDPSPKGSSNQVSKYNAPPHGDHEQALDQRSVSLAEKQGSCCRGDHGPVVNVVYECREKPNSSSEKAFLSSLWNWVFGWPGFAFFFLLLFLFWPSRLKVLLSPFQSFKFFGTEFVLNRAGGEEVEERLATLRLKEKEKFDNGISLRTVSVSVKFQKLVEDYMRPKLSEFESLQLRATIHVQDLLFEDALYQLLDYYPGPGSGRGRSFSSRSGIIGKAWRLGKSQYAEVVPVEEERLILDWGMTRTEADRAGHGRQSFGCVVLRSIDDKLGLVYFDSPTPRAFGKDQSSQLWVDLEANINKGAIETGLIEALSALNRDLIRPSAFIRVFP